MEGITLEELMLYKRMYDIENRFTVSRFSPKLSDTPLHGYRTWGKNPLELKETTVYTSDGQLMYNLSDRPLAANPYEAHDIEEERAEEERIKVDKRIKELQRIRQLGEIKQTLDTLNISDKYVENKEGNDDD